MPSDLWTGPLTCPHCGTRHPSDDVFIATPIQGDPAGRTIRIGDLVDVDPAAVLVPHYLRLRADHGSDAIRILETWDCRSCGTPCWVQIDVRDGRFVAMSAVRLDPETLGSADLIATPDLRDRFEQWTGVTLFPNDDWSKPPRPDWQQILRAFLAEHPQ